MTDPTTPDSPDVIEHMCEAYWRGRGNGRAKMEAAARVLLKDMHRVQGEVPEHYIGAIDYAHSIGIDLTEPADTEAGR